MLNRRSLLASISAALFGTSLGGWTHGASNLLHNGGRAGANTYLLPAYYSPMLIDRVKQSSGFISSGTGDKTWISLLNDDGYPQSMPGSSQTWSISECYIYGNAGDVWVVDCPGNSCTFSATASWTGGSLSAPSVISATRKEYTIVGSPQGTVSGIVGGALKLAVTVTAMAAPLTSMRVYRKTDESYLTANDATGIFTQEWMAVVGPLGILRIMDGNDCNDARLYEWADRRQTTHANWVEKTIRGSWWRGVATVNPNSNTYVVPTPFGTLTNGKPFAFWQPSRPVAKTVTAVTNGNPNTTFTVPAHGFSGGEKITAPLDVSGGGSTWPNAMQTKSSTTGLPPDFVVSVVDANNITIPLNSTGFSAPNTNVSQTLSGIVGVFTVAETVTGGTSGATGVVVSFSGSSLVLGSTTGNFAVAETVTGGTSGAHGVITTSQGAFLIYPEIAISDGTTTLRVLGPSLENSFLSGWSGTASPGQPMYPVYNAQFNCMIMAPDTASDYQLGLPVDAWVKLANYLRCHLWLTFPITCSADFWTQLATQVKASLNSNLWFMTERGNEIWNPGTSFWQTKLTASICAVQFGGGLSIDIGYAGLFNIAKNAINTVYGSASNWKMVLGCQGNGLTTNRLQGNAFINGGNPANYPANNADYIATAPYEFLMYQTSSPNPNTYPGLLNRVDDFKNGSPSAKQAAFQWLADELNVASSPGYGSGLSPYQLTGWVTLVQAQAATISGAGYTGRLGTGLPQIGYEGSQLQVTGNLRNSATPVVVAGTAPQSGNAIVDGDYQNFWFAFLSSTQMGTFMYKHLEDLKNAGMQFPNVYTIASPWTILVNSVPNIGANNFGLYLYDSQIPGAGVTPMWTRFQDWNAGRP